MDILIKNMKMPRKGQYLQILIDENGEMSYEHVYYGSPRVGFILHKSKAVALPSHGDLVDISPIKDKMSRIMNRYDIDDWGGKLADLIENAETIVEATE